MNMAPVREKQSRKAGPPEAGWTLGAGGLPRAFWGILALLLLALGVYLLAVGYIGYGGVILLLAAAAAFNLW
jgi:hypothetical protein